MTAVPVTTTGFDLLPALARASQFPRLRYMGSKYKLLPHLAAVFAEVGGRTALDAFSGSGVVSYLLKAQGYQVTSNDFLQFPTAITRATVVNHATRLTKGDIDRICGRPADREHTFIRDTYAGVFFDEDDLRFLDSAWSHIDRMTGHKRALAIAALVLSAARKQPRGVFTFTGSRYDDGRRDLHIPIRQHFRERVAEYNAVVFNNGRRNRAINADIAEIDPAGYDVVYLDPPYAPPTDDADYIKRYHFLEGLSCYWRGQTIMEDTVTKKIAKKFTPFAYKNRIVEALRNTFKQFHESTIVLSYSSNALPKADVIEMLLGEVKAKVEIRRIDHRYHFGTHRAAERRNVDEYIFIGR
ncbi:MAG TPA: DNA adenine methylase [Jatrophihabitans sp.]|nr:DNA adenine methylase [Jatrophihabitans sp.]